MAITNTVMINQSSQLEYGLMVSEPNGITVIHHLSKDFEKLSQDVLNLVDARSNPTASGRHYFISEKTENKPKAEISVVEIASNNPKETFKWEAKTFQDAYLDFHQAFRFHPGAVTRKVAFGTRPSLVTFDSFIAFVTAAYPADYSKWKMVDSDLAWIRKTFAIPTLK